MTVFSGSSLHLPFGGHVRYVGSISLFYFNNGLNDSGVYLYWGSVFVVSSSFSKVLYLSTCPMEVDMDTPSPIALRTIPGLS